MGTELANFARDLRITLAPTTRSRDIAAVARTTLAAAQIAHRIALGRSPSYRTWVDGRFGGALDTVKPSGGKIEIEFDLVDTGIVRWIAEMLRQFSPVLTGAYRDSHVLLADGAEVDPFGRIPQAKLYEFISTAIYAAKIERELSPQRPDGVYQAVALLAARRSNMDIRFAYGTRSDAVIPKQKFGRFADSGKNWTGKQPIITVRGVA